MKKIEDFKEYAATPNGNVYSLKFNKVKKLKPRIRGAGYNFVTMTKDGKQKHQYVHRIVAKLFINNPNQLPFVNHIDGNKNNNNVENLEWCTRIHNAKHAVINGLINPSKGVCHYKTRHSEIDIINMRSEIKSGSKKSEVARKYGVSLSFIYNINKRITWKHI